MFKCTENGSVVNLEACMTEKKTEKCSEYEKKHELKQELKRKCSGIKNG